MEEIRHLILEGGLSPGDRLLSERELSTQLKVSRTVIREALKSLEMLGMVEVKAGGTFIKEPELKGIYHTLSYTMALDSVTIFDLLETRKIIEVQAIKLASIRRTSNDLAIISVILEEMKQAFIENDFQKSVAADHKFHSYIVKSSQNKVLSIMMEAASDLFIEVLSITREKLGQYSGMDKAIYAQHFSIFKAIKDQDVEYAEKIMTEHLDSLENELKMIFQGIEPELPRIDEDDLDDL
ncbi:FadR/GntR family transcriptional regulator [Peribacillus butanolivorans]|uniref:FadR/GntR family transcriptional regulator n=1 Tax=Peribacillus TaxID=2675229 RepID=UPI001912B45F|nr:MULTISPECIES: FadR/GntR family transcriptional regulator [unclassified Peribacillus]MBK5446359.1 FadR family transcriptional regulator [Peribacillus sp. TH24]MBK5458975.1 FadR family transcriptional regulator [Peribacillus sp. TH27]MBK5480785.1 FadR family transcriptional regulator [Peribacillus sp. TH16]MBK5502336.1 FadR family transcriptional regulator [Peribacillus sp. TH14]WMX57744.1 FadR/GntR family transcriptional regulator [Peribacillus sp. R9-11]